MVTSILDTEDEFITAIPWGNWVTVLLHRRRHGGRIWIRFRRWNKHRTMGCWYPTKRFFVIPERMIQEMIDALEMAAVGSIASQKPDWLIAREEAEDKVIRHIEESGADDASIAVVKRRIEKDRRGRI